MSNVPPPPVFGRRDEEDNSPEVTSADTVEAVETTDVEVAPVESAPETTAVPVKDGRSFDEIVAGPQDEVADEKPVKEPTKRGVKIALGVLIFVAACALGYYAFSMFI